MSWVKRQLERQMAEGWHSSGDKYVCPKCFEDCAIRRFIRKAATSGQCSYCERTSKKPIAVGLDEVLSFISAGLHREYEDPNNCVPWETAEGGWQLPVEDTYDLFVDLGFGDCPDKLFDDLTHAFSDRQWAQRDPFSLRPSDALRFTWESFCDQIKHKTRFVFFKTKSDPESMRELGCSEPYDILQTLGRMARQFQMFDTLPSGATIFRARQHLPGTSPASAVELGPPPKEFASQSRMSPAGIPMFYGANSKQTAFCETYDASDQINTAVTTATFLTTRPLRLLDLTTVPGVPSIFDAPASRKRPALIFLHGFCRDASQPVTKDGRKEHYEYVPTQVVAEYFRHVFDLKGRKNLDGIKFKSSRDKGGICYTLFLTSDDCTDMPPKSDKTLTLSDCKTANANSAKTGSTTTIEEEFEKLVADKLQKKDGESGAKSDTGI